MRLDFLEIWEVILESRMGLKKQTWSVCMFHVIEMVLYYHLHCFDSKEMIFAFGKKDKAMLATIEGFQFRLTHRRYVMLTNSQECI